MRYPTLKNYLLWSEDENGERSVFDPFTYDSFDVERRVYDFAVQLDGATDPRAIRGYTSAERAACLKALRRMRLLRQSRILEKPFGTVMVTLFYRDINLRLGRIAAVWSRIVRLGFLPVLVASFIIRGRANLSWEGSVAGGYVFGLLSGLALHELSHAAACIDCGGVVREIGFMIRFFIPGAYVLMLPEEIPNRFKRIRVYAAGCEMNLLLCGCAYTLSAFLPFDAFYTACGITNLLLAAINLCFFFGLDGSRIIGELLGSDTFMTDVWRILFSGGACVRLLKKPYGAAILSAGAILLACQITAPLLILHEILSLAEVIF